MYVIKQYFGFLACSLFKPIFWPAETSSAKKQDIVAKKSTIDLEIQIINSLQALVAKHYFFILYNILLYEVIGAKLEKFIEILHY